MSILPPGRTNRDVLLAVLAFFLCTFCLCSGIRCEVSCSSRPNPEPTWKSSGR